MSFAICPLSVVPVRNAASHKSEMVSQILFGELVEVLETKGRQWLRVRCEWDNYLGWVAANQLSAVTPSEFEHYQRNYAYCLELRQAIHADEHFLPITIGAQLPDFDGLRFRLANEYYNFTGQAVFPVDLKPTAALVLKIAERYLHTPYLWGGRSAYGIDSSGLVQMVYKLCGIRLPREAEEQVFHGEAVDFVEQSQPGDVAFFENRVGRIAHCGILLPDREILHAHGRVRIDKLDHYGIYDRQAARYTHRLRVTKRLLPAEQPPPEPSLRIPTVTSNQVELF